MLVVWVGPVTFVQTDSWELLRWLGAPEGASAESQVIPTGTAILLEPQTPLKLRLRDGSVFEGRFPRRALLDSTVYASRFEAHTLSSPFVPFSLSETLHVSLRDDREWTAPFAGYGELTLLLRSPEGALLRAPFEFVSEIRRTNGDRVEPVDLARAFHAGLLPSAEALEMELCKPTRSITEPCSIVKVPVEDIASVSPELPSGVSPAGIVVLSVVATLVLIFVLLANSKPKAPSCDIWPGSIPGTWGARVTTRPFDRERGCYVGDALAVADPWPGPIEGDSTAFADAMTIGAIGR